jgi:hypothetical protein
MEVFMSSNLNSAPGIDLVITKTVVPEKLHPGESFSVSWTLKNQGSVSSDSSSYYYYSYDAVYFSTDGVYDESDMWLTSRNWPLPINPGDEYTKTAFIAASSDYPFFGAALPLGNGYLLFRADAGNNQLETNEDNNLAVVPITVTRRDVDLIITSATAPPEIITGDTFSWSATVKNQGSEETSGRSWYDSVYFSTDGILDNSDIYLVSNDWYYPLDPGQTYTRGGKISSPLTTSLPVGNGYLLFKTNINGNQPETEEYNNLYALPITVKALTKVDLVITGVTAPATIKPGDFVSLSLTVKNQGLEATNISSWYDAVYFSSDAAYDPSDTSLSQGIWDKSVKAGATYTQTLTLDSAQTLGLQSQAGFLLFKTNDGNYQPETDNNNNVYAVPININQRPVNNVDLVTTSATAPSRVDNGSYFYVSWTVKNQGSQKINFADTVFYVSADASYDPSDIAVSGSSVGSLDAGKDYTNTETVSGYNLTIGNQYLLFVTDPNNYQPETNEDNNVYALPIVVVPVGFDPAQYGASYSDLTQAYGYDLDGLTQHYLKSGLGEGRNPDTFDEKSYVASYDDLIRAYGTDYAGATEHFIRNGAGEGRKTDIFNASQYLASNTDLIWFYGYDLGAATQHFINSGSSEGRSRDNFSEDIYLASYGDLIAAFGYNLEAATRHYIGSSFGEGRAKAIFDPVAYLNKYSDLQAVFGSDTTAATRHFIESGYYEGRTSV